MFCREIVSDLRAARAADPDFPRVVLVHQGTQEQGEAFFAEHWPDAIAIADPERSLYRRFRVRRGRMGEVLGARSLIRGLAAALRGNGLGKVQGDPLQMPGSFLIHKGEVIWRHDPAHAGDQPDLDDLRAHLPTASASP